MSEKGFMIQSSFFSENLTTYSNFRFLLSPLSPSTHAKYQLEKRYHTEGMDKIQKS